VSGTVCSTTNLACQYVGPGQPSGRFPASPSMPGALNSSPGLTLPFPGAGHQRPRRGTGPPQSPQELAEGFDATDAPDRTSRCQQRGSTLAALEIDEGEWRPGCFDRSQEIPEAAGAKRLVVDRKRPILGVDIEVAQLQSVATFRSAQAIRPSAFAGPTGTANTPPESSTTSTAPKWQDVAIPSLPRAEFASIRAN
jgi:hypothetical protein